MKLGGITSRAFFIGWVPAALVTVMLAAYFTKLQHTDLDSALMQRSALLARQLAVASAQPFANEDRVTLQHFALNVATEPGVNSVRMLRPNGTVLAAATPPGRESFINEPTSLHTIRVPIGRPVVDSAASGGVKEEKVGIVELTVSDAFNSQAKNNILFRALSTVLIALLLAGLLSLYLSRVLAKPIKKLVAAADEFARGNLDALAITRAPKELLSIAASLNSLGAALRTAQANMDTQIQAVSAELALRAGSEARTLTSEKEAAEAANRAKSRFLAAATHDLRQPLHALGLFSGALLEKIRYPEVRNLVVNINKSVEALDGLFNSLLDISKLDAGVIEPSRAAFALQTLFDKLTRDYQPQAEAKGITLKIRPCGYVVYSDAAIVERILRNLISNAIAYTDKKGVLVGARKRGDRVSIDVWDCGRGIADTDIKDIFQEFYQMGNRERDRSKGLGLGLAIVARLTKLLDSQIRVHSVMSRGSVFSFEIPLTSIAPQPEVLFASLPINNIMGAFIVIIDDERTILDGMAALLSDWGCRLILATSIADALSQLIDSDVAPDLLIADYRLASGATGIEALIRLQSEYGKGIPGILITGDTSPDRLREAKASGYYILHKPVRAPKLRTLLSYALEHAETR